MPTDTSLDQQLVSIEKTSRPSVVIIQDTDSSPLILDTRLDTDNGISKTRVIAINCQSLSTLLARANTTVTAQNYYATAQQLVSSDMLDQLQDISVLVSVNLETFLVAYCLMEFCRNKSIFLRWVHVIADKEQGRGKCVHKSELEPFLAAPDAIILAGATVDHGIFQGVLPIEKVFEWPANKCLVDVLDAIQYMTPAEVFQGPGSNAGQPAQLARALRANGLSAVSASIAQKNKFGYASDYTFPEFSEQSRIAFFKWVMANFRLIHYHARPLFWRFHDGNLLSPTALDMMIAKSMGKSIVFSFRGGEARDYTTFAQHSPYAWQKADDYADFLSDASKTRYVKLVSDIADVVTVTDPELATYVPNSKILPRSIDCGLWQSVGPIRSTNPLVLHAPSRRGVKGTEYVLRAVEALRERGLKFEFQLVEGLNNSEARKLYESADIIVDQLRIGWYGVLAVEAMALGKTVISYVRNDLLDFFGKNPPLLIASPDTIENVLEEAVRSNRLRQQMSARARKFCESYHHYENVSKIAQAYYADAQRTSKSSSMDTLISLYNDFGTTVLELTSTKYKMQRDNVVLKNRLKSEQRVIADQKIRLEELAQEMAITTAGLRPSILPRGFTDLVKSLSKNARDLEALLGNAELNKQDDAQLPVVEPINTKNVLKKEPIIIGEITSFSQQYIGGWATDTANVGSPVSIKVYYRSELLAESLANQPTPPQLKTAEPRCGFMIQLPRFFQDGKSRRIFVRAGEKETILKGAPLIIGPELLK